MDCSRGAGGWFKQTHWFKYVVVLEAEVGTPDAFKHLQLDWGTALLSWWRCDRPLGYQSDVKLRAATWMRCPSFDLASCVPGVVLVLHVSALQAPPVGDAHIFERRPRPNP